MTRFACRCLGCQACYKQKTQKGCGRRPHGAPTPCSTCYLEAGREARAAVDRLLAKQGGAP